MNKRIIAIIDTGLSETQAIEQIWQGFDYERIDLLGGGQYHAHGTLVANLLMRPFDTDELRDKAKFFHIRAGDRYGSFAPHILKQAFALTLGLKATVVNCSLGAPDFDLPELENPEHYDGIYRTIAEEYIQPLLDAGIVIHAAAGNSDDRQFRGGDPDPDINYPWRLFKRGEVLVWGSIKKDGYASDFSSDGEQLFGVFWGENIEVKNSAGIYVIGSGTSYATPKACGLWERDRTSGVTAAELRRAWIDIAVHEMKDDSGIWREYVNPETGEKWHAKFGWGTQESYWQFATRNARSRPKRLRIAAADRKIRFHDFRRVT